MFDAVTIVAEMAAVRGGLLGGGRGTRYAFFVFAPPHEICVFIDIWGFGACLDLNIFK